MKMILALLIIDIVSAQQTDIVNAIIVPEIVLFVMLYGLLKLFRLPKIISLIGSISICVISYVTGLILVASSYILSLGSLAATGIYIFCFLIGAVLISKSSTKKIKPIKFLDVKKSNRMQISKEISILEKRIVELQNELEKVKIQEHNLELKFSTTKNQDVLKELDKIRKMKNKLADSLDMLIERREIYKRAYREAT